MSWVRKSKLASMERRMDSLEIYARSLENAADEQNPEHRMDGLQIDVSELERRVDNLEVDYDSA